MTARTCPVAGCGRALGTTRNGDPYLMCPRHYAKLTNSQMIRLWRTYKAWKRLERQRLRIRAETGGVSAGLLSAIATAVSEYIDVRNECIKDVADVELELAQ